MCDALMCRQLDDLQREIYMYERERERAMSRKKHRINDSVRNVLCLVGNKVSQYNFMTLFSHLYMWNSQII